MKGITSLAGNHLKSCVEGSYPSIVVSVIKLVSILDIGLTVVK